jgi:hypothetical protein
VLDRLADQHRGFVAAEIIVDDYDEPRRCFGANVVGIGSIMPECTREGRTVLYGGVGPGHQAAGTACSAAASSGPGSCSMSV